MLTISAGILKTHNGEKSNKCDQCEFTSFQTDNLWRHLKKAQLKKSNKCNQYNFVSIQANNLRRHFKNAQWRKIKQVRPMQLSSIQATNFRRYLKTHNLKNPRSVTIVKIEKNQTSEKSATLHQFKLRIWGAIWKKHIEKKKQVRSVHLCIKQRWQFEEAFYKRTFEKNQTSATSATLHQSKLTFWGGILKMHNGENSNKCNQCNFASIQADILRRHLKNAQWRKIKQVRPVRLCINSSWQFEEADMENGDPIGMLETVLYCDGHSVTLLWCSTNVPVALSSLLRLENPKGLFWRINIDWLICLFMFFAC